MPPWAAFECERTGWTFERMPTFAPASAAASAARSPARPAPITRTSCAGIRSGFSLGPVSGGAGFYVTAAERLLLPVRPVPGRVLTESRLPRENNPSSYRGGQPSSQVEHSKGIAPALQPPPLEAPPLRRWRGLGVLG